MEKIWTLEEPKKNFDVIAYAAYADAPQYVKDCSHQDLVIATKNPPVQEESREQRPEKNFVEFLMSIPKEELFLDEKNRQDLNLRDVEF